MDSRRAFRHRSPDETEPGARGRMSGILMAEDFEPHVGKTFRFRGTPFELVLDHIEFWEGDLPPGALRRPFLLIFDGPRGADFLREGIYECEAEDGAAFSLHVSPIQTTRPGRQEYQAAFN